MDMKIISNIMEEYYINIFFRYKFTSLIYFKVTDWKMKLVFANDLYFEDM